MEAKRAKMAKEAKPFRLFSRLGKLSDWVLSIGYWPLSCQEKTLSFLLFNDQFPIANTQWPHAMSASLALTADNFPSRVFCHFCHFCFR